MVGEKVVNLHSSHCGRGVTLRINNRQGVTPCFSLAGAKGDLCYSAPFAFFVQVGIIFKERATRLFLKIVTA